jgi:hypothetical protein
MADSCGGKTGLRIGAEVELYQLLRWVSMAE